MNILGVYPATIGHDSNAALVKDGKLVAAAEEERFTRVKHTNTPP
jgi:predicted NodU family carbamoyl transferase